MAAKTTQELTDELQRFLRERYREEIGKLAQHYPREQRSLYVDWDEIYRFDRRIAEDVKSQPEKILAHFEEALRLYDLPVDVDLSNAHVRIYNLHQQHPVNEVSRANNVGMLMDVPGQVKKVSKVKPRVREAAFECQRCGTMTFIPQKGGFQEPHECKGCERQGPFTIDYDESDFIDHQLALIQQPPEKTKGGSAAEMEVHLEDDLIMEFEVGDKVTLTSIMRLEQDTKGNKKSRDFDTVLEGHSVVREESDYEDIDVGEHIDEIRLIASGEKGDPFDLLVDSINPKHHGDHDVKLAIALQLFGGWSRSHPGGAQDRGDSHILLMGDPGCGKSTFLRSVDDIAPRSVYASGKGASAAGLTAAAVADDFGDSKWSLDAGAMVLADGGVACIDEIDKMDEQAVSSMHDALESQKVHVNKAGINTTLSSRTALLAAGNPENGRFDSYRPRAEQIDMDPALMSRFDLYFMVSDNPDPDQDREVVGHQIESRQVSGKHARGEELSEEERERHTPKIDRDVLRAYIAHAKESCKPIIDDEDVKRRITEFFVGLRSQSYNEGDDAETDTPIAVTYRQVEGIQRLAEASARVRLSDEVELEDAKRAIQLVTESMKQVGFDPETGQFDADIVDTGQSKSQKKRREGILEFIREEGEVTTEEIQEEFGIDMSVLQADLNHLSRRKGFIYDRGGGIWLKA